MSRPLARGLLCSEPVKLCFLSAPPPRLLPRIPPRLPLPLFGELPLGSLVRAALLQRAHNPDFVGAGLCLGTWADWASLCVNVGGNGGRGTEAGPHSLLGAWDTADGIYLSHRKLPTFDGALFLTQKYGSFVCF